MGMEEINHVIEHMVNEEQIVELKFIVLEKIKYVSSIGEINFLKFDWR